MKNPDHETDLEINIKFFEIWQENAATIKLLKAIDIDCLLTQKFKEHWRKHNSMHILPQFPDRAPALGEYINNYLAYSYVGILRRWISDDMKYSPEVLGQMLYQLTGPPVLDALFEKFNQDFI